MIAEEVLDDMARSQDRVRQRVSEYSARVLALAEVSRILGKKFTFEDAKIDDKVNAILVELSDAVLEDMVYYAKRDLPKEEDDDTVIAWARLTTNAQNTVDKYSSHLKFILEGWLAIGFANKLSGGDILTCLMTYMENPYITPLWMKAFEDGMTYSARIIREGGYRWGKGTPISPVKGMSLVESNFINTAYQKGVVNGFIRGGAIGYRVHRGSSYDCAYCDELTLGIHPLTDIVLPAHPRCCCYVTPVYKNEI